MSMRCHPNLPHIQNFHLYGKDLELVGIRRIQIFKMLRGTRDKLLWDFKHTDVFYKWEVMFDYSDVLTMGDIVNTGVILQCLSDLYSYRFKTAWIKLFVADFIDGSLLTSIKREFDYWIDIQGKNRYDVVPLCKDKGYTCLGDVMRPRVKYVKKGLHRKYKAAPPKSRLS